MDPTISVSKGCFVFKNGATRAEGTAKKSKGPSKATALLGNDITGQPFYRAYSQAWIQFITDIERLQRECNSKTINDLITHIEKAYENEDPGANILPAVALLTGINQPDHYKQFITLSECLSEKLLSCVCVQSRDCANIKNAIEMIVYGFVIAPFGNEDREHKRLRRSQCTMQVLCTWYKNCKEKKNLVIILPDFERFNAEVLQDLILILSSYCRIIPMVLVLGVATSESTLHSTLPYHVTSKIRLEIFQTQAAPIGLNEILEKVILSPKHSIHLSGKTFKFLTHIFLFYDFSINGFIQGFKYCLMEHYLRGNAYSLCTDYGYSLKIIKQLTHEDMECIRRLLSFRPYVEGLNDCKKVISILTDDNYLKKKLPQLLRDCHLYFIYFRIFLTFITSLVHDLPKAPLGKFERELYVNCLLKDVTETCEFKEAWKMLSFMSKDDFVTKISQALTSTIDFVKLEIEEISLADTCRPIIDEKINAIKDLLTIVVMAGIETTQKNACNADEMHNLKQISRHDLKEKLLQMSKKHVVVSAFTKSVNDTLEFIEHKIVKEYLKPLSKAPPLHELFVFSDMQTIRRNIIGSPRAALHMALNNPKYYLQCKCCELENSSDIITSLPDLSIAYKLHLECGRMINLFDWLQAFRAVVDYNEDDNDQIDPKIQARFTRSVAELQFLGYIKTSKRKTDHVTRLTW